MLLNKKYRVLTPDKNLASSIKSLYNTDEIMSALLALRVKKAEDSKFFLESSLDLLHDPFLFKNMKACTERLKKAIQNKERIYIFGDRDVDGVCSSVILHQFLKSQGIDTDIFVPSNDDNYGFSQSNIDKAKNLGVSLIITVDVGITLYREIAYAKSQGIDIVVLDHHKPLDHIPDCIIINPKLPDSGYPFDGLSAAGVVYKVLCAMHGTNVERYLDLVALSTVADIMPLENENVVIVKKGLEVINKRERLSLANLLSICKVTGSAVTTKDIAFSVAPLINAAGRLGQSEVAIKVFLEEDKDYIDIYSRELFDLNTERQKLTRDFYEKLKDQAKSSALKNNSKIAFVYSADIPRGILGLLASLFSKELGITSVVTTECAGQKAGSVRTQGNVDAVEMLMSAKEMLGEYGGHGGAAGFHIDSDKDFELFKSLCVKYVNSVSVTCKDDVLNVDMCIRANELTNHLVDIVDTLEPYGTSNNRPVFLFENLKVNNISRFLGRNSNVHLKLSLEGAIPITAIMWNEAELGQHIRIGDRINVLGSIEPSYFRGNKEYKIVFQDMEKTSNNK